DVLQADRQPDIAVGDTGRLLLLRRQLRVRGGRRMDRQAARVADVGHVEEQLQRVDEATSRFPPFLELEADEATEAALQVRLRATLLLAGEAAGMDDAR